MILVSFDGDCRLPFYYIANGKSPRGVLHSVIYKAGELFHDPHPSKTGIESVETSEILVRVDELASLFRGQPALFADAAA